MQFFEFFNLTQDIILKMGRQFLKNLYDAVKPGVGFLGKHIPLAGLEEGFVYPIDRNKELDHPGVYPPVPQFYFGVMPGGEEDSLAEFGLGQFQIQPDPLDTVIDSFRLFTGGNFILGHGLLSRINIPC
jgi:hypothetical protein